MSLKDWFLRRNVASTTHTDTLKEDHLRELLKEVERDRQRAVSLRLSAQPDRPEEPDWQPPTDLDRQWAKNTMPGKAEGHTMAWRAWNVVDHRDEDDQEISTEELLGLGSADAFQRLIDFYQEVEKLRQMSASDRFRLCSVTYSSHEWAIGEPSCGFDQNADADHLMISFAKPGIYGVKSPERCPHGEVIGQVALWGTMVEHENGYRARWAYPTKLYVGDRDDLLVLGEIYGCECVPGYPEGYDAERNHLAGWMPVSSFAQQSIVSVLAQQQQDAMRRQLQGHFSPGYPFR